MKLDSESMKNEPADTQEHPHPTKNIVASLLVFVEMRRFGACLHAAQAGGKKAKMRCMPIEDFLSAKNK